MKGTLVGQPQGGGGAAVSGPPKPETKGLCSCRRRARDGGDDGARRLRQLRDDF